VEKKEKKDEEMRSESDSKHIPPPLASSLHLFGLGLGVLFWVGVGWLGYGLFFAEKAHTLPSKWFSVLRCSAEFQSRYPQIWYVIF
jgi:hypothetical protein